MLKRIALYAMALFYVVAGMNHFRDTGLYLRMMPPWIPAHERMVQLSGIAEVLLGLGLLFRKTRPFAAWGVIALLIAVFPANVYMYANRDALFAEIPAMALLIRLPAQGLLIWWAYLYTKRGPV
ncbi:MAG: DoxX family protein [Bacteriovoracia bacterium]